MSDWRAVASVVGAVKSPRQRVMLRAWMRTVLSGNDGNGEPEPPASHAGTTWSWPVEGLR